MYGFAFFLRVTHCDGTKIGQGNEDLLLVPNSLLSLQGVAQRNKSHSHPRPTYRCEIIGQRGSYECLVRVPASLERTRMMCSCESLVADVGRGGKNDATPQFVTSREFLALPAWSKSLPALVYHASHPWGVKDALGRTVPRSRKIREA